MATTVASLININNNNNNNNNNTTTTTTTHTASTVSHDTMAVQQSNGSVVGVKDDDNDIEADFLAFPPKVAAKAKFPPRCSVLVVGDTRGSQQGKNNNNNNDETPTVVYGGVVMQVGINLEDDADDDRTNHYKIQLQDDNANSASTKTMFVQEKYLYLAEGAPVWLYNKPTTTTTTTTSPCFDPAVVIGSTRMPASDVGLIQTPRIYHSVQVLTRDGHVSHGILPHHLIYRSSDVPPTKAPKEPPTSNFVPTSTTTVLHVQDRSSPVSSLSSASETTVATKSRNETPERDDAAQVSAGPATRLPACGLFQKDVAWDMPLRVPKRVSISSTDTSVSTSSLSLASATDGNSNSNSQKGGKPTNKAGGSTEFARIMSVLQASAAPKARLTKFTAQGGVDSKKTLKRVSIVEPKKEETKPLNNDLQDLMPVIPRKAKKIKTSSLSPVVGDADASPGTPSLLDSYACLQDEADPPASFHSMDEENDLPIENWVKYAASLPASSSTEAMTPSSGGFTVEDIEDDTRSNTFASSSEVATYVTNQNPTVFQTIAAVGTRHYYAAAFKGIRQFRQANFQDNNRAYSGVGEVIHENCLYWQLRGCCKTTCLRKEYHVKLTPERAMLLEQALQPVISPSGPIFCRPIGGMCNDMSYYSGTKGKFGIAENIGFQEEPQKESKVLFSAGPSVPVANTEKELGSITLNLPTYFGSDFFVAAMTGGSAGIKFCDQYSCSIRVEEQRESHGYEDRVPYTSATITGANAQMLRQCWLAIEDVLMQAVPPSLRRYLLFNLGKMNAYRAKHGDMVQTRNPFPPNDDPEELHWLATLKSGNFHKPGHNVIGFSQVCSLERVLEEMFPTCRVEIADPCRESFPKLFPQIIISGPNVEEVDECRRYLFFQALGKPFHPLF